MILFENNRIKALNFIKKQRVARGGQTQGQRIFFKGGKRECCFFKLKISWA